MALFTRKGGKGSNKRATSQVLYLGGEAPAAPGAGPAIEDENAALPVGSNVSEPLFVAPEDEPTRSENAPASPVTEEPPRPAAKASKEPIVDPVKASTTPESGSPSATAPKKSLGDKPAFKFTFGGRRKDAPTYLAEWRKGHKGRPSQVFIGFLPDVTKKDAIAFAIGVAQRHSSNLVNTAYAVYPHNSGWAYEVHEGGPRRGYLPRILQHFDEQAGGPITDESAVTIETAQRRVRVERTQTGLTGFLMPERFQDSQTPWLEPGPHLNAAVPLRGALVAFGAMIFVTGFLALIVTLVTRPAPLPLNAAARVAVSYESLPISQWSKLVQTYSEGGVVDSLRWQQGRWTIKLEGSDTKPSVSNTRPATAAVNKR